MKNITKFFKSNFIRNNWLIIAYAFIAIVSELTGVAVTAHKFYIRTPFVFLSIVLAFSIILYFIRSQSSRFIVATVLLGLHGIMNIGFIIVYEMTGQIFDYTMLELRQDAWGILESVPINVVYFMVFGVMYSAFIVFAGRFAQVNPKLPSLNKFVLKCITIITASIALLVGCIASSITYKDFYNELLYSTEDKSYNDLGVTGTVLSQLVAGATKKSVELGDPTDIQNFIFNPDEIHKSNFQDNYNKDFNVVTVLCESFEWMAMIEDLDRFPMGLDLSLPADESNTTKSAAEVLFPNLYEFYEEAVVMSNFHSKEKTDISENYSYMGAYPTNAITNYDFPTNTLSTTMANTLKALDPELTTQIFHNGNKTFYNRSEYELAAGFDKFYACEDMADMGMFDWMNDSGERNLDSKMIETCADLMFPTDNRFFTYIITITQHGQYKHRSNLELEGYYDRLAKFGLAENGDESHDAFVTYVAATLELDKAIGTINEELIERDLKDKTIVSLYGDHNCYYSGLSGYIKNIDTYSQAQSENINYIDLYNVPFMMRVPGVEHQVIDKFTATCDIVPTIYDVLGINYYKNVFYGNSAFDEEESILYSRAYNFFCTDDILYTSLNRIKFAHKGAVITDDITNRTKKLVTKIEYTDRIFYNDFFSLDISDKTTLSSEESSLKTYADLYNARLKALQLR